MYGPGPGSGQGGLGYYGRLRPYSRRPSAPPAWEETIEFAKRGRNYTTITCRVREATTQYPTVGLFIQMHNGRDSCFSRFTATSDLRAIAAKLVEWADKLEASVLPPLNTRAAALDAQLRIMEEQQRLLQGQGGFAPGFNPYAGQGPQTPYPLDDEED